MKETLKSKKGITLIALIITIIVLIILAGISIAVLTGEDGLITKAKQGAQNYQNAAVEEQERLNTLYAQAGTQLTSGSTNNSGTPVSQGTTSGAGLTQEEHEWLERIANYNKPIYDINPYQLTNNGIYAIYRGGGSDTQPLYANLPVCGYKCISIKPPSSTYNTTMTFYNKDGVTLENPITVKTADWTDYYEIPEDAVIINIAYPAWASSNTWAGYYSMLMQMPNS